MHASDAPSGAAHHIRRRPAAILQDAFEWRKTAQVAYSESRAGTAEAGIGGENARRPATRRPREQHRRAGSYNKDLEFALEQRLAETIPSAPHYREGAGVDPGRRSSKRRRPLKGSEPSWKPAHPVQHYSTDSSFVLNDDQLRLRPQKLAKRGANPQRSVVSEWSTLEPDCSAPRGGYTPSHALYIAMICQGRKEMSPAYPPPVEAARLLFERAVPESATNVSVTSSAVAASISTAPRRSPTPTSTVKLASSSGLRTSTRPRVQPAVTPLAIAVETAGLTPQQAEQAQRAALQSYIDSAFSAAASSLDDPAGTSTSSPTSSPASASPSPSSSPSRYTFVLFQRAHVLPQAGADLAPACSHHRNLARIIAPAVIVPVVVIAALIILACCLWRRRKRKSSGAPTPGRTTPSGLGPISNPRPLMATAIGPDGSLVSRPGTAFEGTEELLAAGAGGATGTAAAMGRARGGESSDSVATTPSAIGVAFSEPRTPWGRRSLVDVFAGGVRSATGSPAHSSPGHQRVLSTSSSFAGRQPSLKSSSSVPSELRGVGGYNIFGYQPGQPRPVVAPVTGRFDQPSPASIVPVPESAQRHSSEEGSISGYSGEDASVSGSAGSYTARLAPPLGVIGYPHVPQAQQSRTTQRTSDGEQGYWTAEAGLSSTDGGHDPEEAERLSDASPLEEAVNFGSSTSGGSGSGSIGGRSGSISAHRSSEEGQRGSRTSTPRLGAGHGSIGNRRNDGSGSWWNA